MVKKKVKLIKLNVVTDPPAKIVNEFAESAGRGYANINNAIDDGELTGGVAFAGKNSKGLKMVVMDDKAKTYIAKCKAFDKFARKKPSK